jgi:hypothetical protein
MKKKLYLSPETLVVEVELQRMIALSRTDDVATDADALSRETEFYDEDDDYVKSRRTRTCWDDKDELENDANNW